MPINGPVPPQRRISERGKARLRTAARMLKLRGPCDADSEDFAAILAAIDRLDQQRRAELRGLVDWVEAYERQERANGAQRESGQ